MSRIVTKAELASHNTEESMWIAFDGKVYDVTKFFATEHPGGPDPIKHNAGTDATEAFEKVGHSSDARKWRETFLIGELEKEAAPASGGSCSVRGLLTESNACLALAVVLPLSFILIMKYVTSKS